MTRAEYDRARYKKLCKHIRARRIARYSLNKEKDIEHARRRRAKLKGVNERYTESMKKATLKAFNNKCFNCGNKKQLQVDHHKPLSAGYKLTLKNAVILCKSCNCRKHNKMPKQFYNKEQLIKLNKILKNLK